MGNSGFPPTYARGSCEEEKEDSAASQIVLAQNEILLVPIIVMYIRSVPFS